MVEKLPDEFLDVSKDEERRKLTFEELEELVLEHAEDATPTRWGLLPHECPECGSEEFDTGYGRGSEGEIEPWARCSECGWYPF